MTETIVRKAASRSGARPARYRRSKDELEALDDAIIAAVEADQPVTARGVYYRVVSAGAVEKTEKGYAAVIRQLLKLRRNGRVPYGSIVDGTREVSRSSGWRNVEQMIRAYQTGYRRDPWIDQPVDVLIVSEKDAIKQAVLQVTNRYQVGLGVLRGYASETFAHEVARSLGSKRTHIAQLGDHDPSGLDAWRDFTERVAAFAPSADVTFERIAVTPEQIVQYQLPTRPTKKSDSRAKKFDGDSVEVDALPARVLRQVVEDTIVQRIDTDAWDTTRQAEQAERERLGRFAEGGI